MGLVLEIVLPGRGQMTYLGEGKVCLGGQRYGQTIQINSKMNFIQDSCQVFPLQFKSNYKVYYITQKCIFLKN